MCHHVRRQERKGKERKEKIGKIARYDNRE